MPKRCETESAEHRRKVGEGVKRAWQRRIGEPRKSASGKLTQIAVLMTCKPEDAVEAVHRLIIEHREMCANLRECKERHGIGLGGERLDVLVIGELDRLKSQKE